MEPFRTIRAAKEWAQEQQGTAVCFLLGVRFAVQWHYERETGYSTSCRTAMKERGYS